MPPRISSRSQQVPSNPITVEVEDVTATTLRLRISALPQSLSNALRRILLAEIPTLAIDLVEIKENSSPLFDEMIAHRIGLIPLISHTVDGFQYSRDCTCASSCPNCTVYYQIDVSNVVTSSEEGHVHVVVRSDDLVGMTPNSPLPVGDIPLTKISGNQSLRLTATGKKGIGKMHAKFMCANVSMWYRPVVTIDRDVEMKAPIAVRKAIVASCPRKVFSLDELDHIVVEKEEECLMTGECSKVAAAAGLDKLVNVREDEEVSEWEIETNGARGAVEVVMVGVKLLKDKWLSLLADLEDWEQQ